MVKNLPANAGDVSSTPGSERERLPTPVFFPGACQGKRSLAGYSPWVCKRVRYNLVIKQQQTLSLIPLLAIANTFNRSLAGRSNKLEFAKFSVF